MLAKQDNKIISHYRSVGRGGKQLIEETVKSGSDTANFLAKMEKRRLSQPCNLPIDMRGKVSEDCKAYRLGSLTHHLDNKSREIFRYALAEYDGRYTVGVFETVMAADHTLKAQHKRETDKRLAMAQQQTPSHTNKDPLFDRSESVQVKTTTNNVVPEEKKVPRNTEDSPEPVNLIPFGYQPQRKSDRLNYVTRVNLQLPNGQEVPAKTKDLSLTGIRITLFSSIESLTPDSQLSVKFEELEKEYAVKFSKVHYKVIKHDRDRQGREQVRLILAEPNKTFERFVDEFIKTHKSRYKLELADALTALESAIFERSYLQTRPLFVSLFEGADDSLEPLVTGYTEDTELHLRSVLLARLAHQLPHYPMGHQLLFECFVIQEDDNYHVFAGERSQLVKHALLDDFLKVATRAHFVARLLVDLNTLDKAHLPSFEESSDRYLGKVNTAQKHSQLTSATALAYYSFVEEKLFTNAQLSLQDPALKPLTALRLAQAKGKTLDLTERQFRQLPRYRYKTQVVLQAGTDTFSTHTIDISAQGLQVQLPLGLPTETHWQEGKTISIDMPELQKLAKRKFKLKRLSYRIMKRDEAGETLSLKRDVREINHQGEAFLRKLISENRTKLVPCTRDDEDHEYRQIIESVVSSNLPSIPLFINRFSGGRYIASRAGSSTQNNPLIDLFAHQDRVELSPLNLEQCFKHHIKGKVNRRGQLTEPSKTRLLLRLPNDDNESITITPEEELTDATAFAKFVVEARRNNRLRILMARFYPPATTNFDDFAERVSIVQHNSPSKLNQLEQDVKQLVAMLDLQDITAFFR